MKLVYKKPITSSLRNTILVSTENCEKNYRLKSIIIKKKKSTGRNNQGQLTIFTKGGGHKRLLRIIENNINFSEGIIESIEYDPNRSAFIARLFTAEKKHIYIIACHSLQKGHFIKDFSKDNFFKLYLGSFYTLKQLPLGSIIYNLNFPSNRSQIARSAGCSAKIISKTLFLCRIKLPSGQQRVFDVNNCAFLGSVSNPSYRYINKGKAGRNRWLNRRPKVRGVAMNPVDHPHGGGEGRTSGGRPSVTPWGKVAKGQPTRLKSKKTNKFIIFDKK